jgi:hypothetical protein
MIRNCGLKKRESRELPPEKLKEILSRIYTEEVVDELIGKLVEQPKRKDGAEQ